MGVDISTHLLVCSVTRKNVSAAHQENCEASLPEGGCAEFATSEHSSRIARHACRPVSGERSQAEQVWSSVLSCEYHVLLHWDHHHLQISLQPPHHQLHCQQGEQGLRALPRAKGGAVHGPAPEEYSGNSSRRSCARHLI